MCFYMYLCIFVNIDRQAVQPIRIHLRWGPFHKSSYERVLLYEFVELVLNYRSNEFVAIKNLCEMGPWCVNTHLFLCGSRCNCIDSDCFWSVNSNILITIHIPLHYEPLDEEITKHVN